MILSSAGIKQTVFLFLLVLPTSSNKKKAQHPPTSHLKQNLKQLLRKMTPVHLFTSYFAATYHPGTSPHLPPTESSWVIPDTSVSTQRTTFVRTFPQPWRGVHTETMVVQTPGFGLFSAYLERQVSYCFRQLYPQNQQLLP